MSASKKSGLGRGFDTLIPQDFDAALVFEDQGRIQQIPVGKLISDPDQPRQHFDKESIEQLSSSIKQHGIVQPLVVSPLKNGTYAIVAGERRWRAAKAAALETVPAVVRTLQELERLEVAIVENVQRVDLSPLEQAVSIERLHQQFNMSYVDISKRLGKASTTVNNIVRLLQLPLPARQALEEGKIFEGHARAILALKDYPEKQAELLQAILAKGWTIRQAEQYVVSIKRGFVDTQATKTRMQTETPATKRLGKRLHAPVHIRRTARGGRLEIAFQTDDELEAILRQLGDRDATA